MSTDAQSPTPEPLVIERRSGAITHVTLNRPRAINALSSVMFEMLAGILGRAHAGSGAGEGLAGGASIGSAILLDGAGERGFCGGGDIKELAGEDPRGILALEYAVDHLVATSPVPVVAIMDGIAMGGGIGLGGHAAQRVVTERSRLAMPEARIGIAPDVGGHLLLARAPGRLGELLAVTAGEMGPGDAIALGFADHFIPAARLGELRDALAAGEPPSEACAWFAETPPESAVLAARAWWDPIADEALGAGHAPAAMDPAGAAARLVAALETSADSRATEVGETVREMCPTSVAVTLAQLDRTRHLNLSLAEVLTDDLRVLGRLGARADFAEGVRAQVIDKDRNPRWSPARIEDLDAAVVAALVDPAFGPGETPLVLER